MQKSKKNIFDGEIRNTISSEVLSNATVFSNIQIR